MLIVAIKTNARIGIVVVRNDIDIEIDATVTMRNVFMYVCVFNHVYVCDTQRLMCT